MGLFSGKLIEIEARTLEEARNQMLSRIPKGYSLPSHQTVSIGEKTVQASAETTEVAFAQAANHVPEEAEILERREVRPYERKTITVDAFDQEDALLKAKAHPAFKANVTALETPKLVRTGRKGFLGMGRTPNEYEVELWCPALVEIEYRTGVKITGRLESFIESTTDQAVLGDIGKYSPDNTLRVEAINKLEDRTLLQEIITMSSCPALELETAEKVSRENHNYRTIYQYNFVHHFMASPELCLGSFCHAARWIWLQARLSDHREYKVELWTSRNQYRAAIFLGYSGTHLPLPKKICEEVLGVENISLGDADTWSSSVAKGVDQIVGVVKRYAYRHDMNETLSYQSHWGLTPDFDLINACRTLAVSVPEDFLPSKWTPLDADVHLVAENRLSELSRSRHE